MLTMTQVQTPAADMHPDDVVLYRLHDSVAGPPLFEPGPNYEPVSPAVIVALVPHSAGGLNPVVYMPLWARVFRLRPEVRAAREKAAEAEAARDEALSVSRLLFPRLGDDGWDRVSVQEVAHEEMGIRLLLGYDGDRRCIWGPRDSDRVIWHGSWADVRERVIATLTAYLERKTTRERTSARIVERRDRARALLAAMGVDHG